jgi:hypothetical protein
VVDTIRVGRGQIIELPPPANENAANTEDQKIIQAKKVKMIAKRKLKLAESLKKGFATVFDQ